MEACLNVSALSDPNALIPLVSILPYDLENIRTLVDSGSTHCFADIQFTHQNKFTTRIISLVTLWLFDGSSNFVITQAVDLSILFPATSDVTPMIFYLAPLDSECKIVLGLVLLAEVCHLACGNCQWQYWGPGKTWQK